MNAETNLKKVKSDLQSLFEKHFGFLPEKIQTLAQAGSNRTYYRLSGNEKSTIGAYNPNYEENIAFTYLTKNFYYKGLNVPELLEENLDKHIYLVEDLGDTSLYDWMQQVRTNVQFPEALMRTYQSTLNELIRFQTEGIKSLDLSKCYPSGEFNKQAMLWDLCYFKYYFLLPAGVPFNEKKLDNEFNHLTAFLEESDSGYFLFRDFQSRNVMLKDNKQYFIDYQGGRKGALPYDLASMLFQAKAKIPEPVKVKLLNHYMDTLSTFIPINRTEFTAKFYGFAMLRIMQTLGAYGLRGLIEKKNYFIESLPLAYDNLIALLTSGKIEIKTDYLLELLLSIPENKIRIPEYQNRKKPTIHISSFSYKKGLPADKTKHGGGFIFDCRSLPNPGREEKYQELTGKDKPVIDYLESSPEVQKYLNHALKLIFQAIDNYMKRDFSYMAIHFGCTGGQHRSVYFAQRVSRAIMNNFDAEVVINHRELDNQ